MATIGALTSLYASDRPYANRAWVLAGIALSFSVIVTLGVWAQQWPVMAVPLVVVIAMAATFVCHSLRIGPPGAYMFTLACAAATAIPVPVDRVGWLVLGGGTVSWLVHMSGALIAPRGPETSAVAAAAQAVARFAQTSGIGAKDRARHEAALALYDAWAALVTFQPADGRTDNALTRLRALNRELHIIFAACVSADDSLAATPETLAKRAREIGAETRTLGEGVNDVQVPLGRLRTSHLLLENLTLYSPASGVTMRVGIAVAIAGAIGAALSLERAYWAMAAAVLVLHMGLDWARTLQRGLERTVGTLIGLVLAGAILAVHPTGLWLVATLMCLQFLIEMLVTRNYALAVVFVTCIALVIASDDHALRDPAVLLWARAIDTAIGCGVGLLVHALFGPRGAPVSLHQQIARTLVTAQTALDHVAAADVTSDEALHVRRELQHGIFRLVTSYEANTGGFARDPAIDERMWPTVVATQRLGYKILAACWSIESVGSSSPAHLAREEFANVNAALSKLITAVHDGTGPITPHELSDFLKDEIRDLSDSLVSYRSTPARGTR
jgi:uncharacterized membrane protein YccC